jgi:hypothetical protein
MIPTSELSCCWPKAGKRTITLFHQIMPPRFFLKRVFQKDPIGRLRGDFEYSFGAFCVSSPQLGAFEVGNDLPHPENKFI